MAAPCIDKSISIMPAAGRVTVTFNGRVIASSARALALNEPGHPLRLYIPRADVDGDVLERSIHHTRCPYKGDASYQSLRSSSSFARDAVWYYPDPCPQVAQIKDHLAFWGDQVRYETL